VSDARTTAKVQLAGERWRWWVHVALLATLVAAMVSLVFLSHSITLHVVIGSLFLAFLVSHLAQRRRTVRKLLSQLLGGGRRAGRPPKLAISDAILGFLALNVLLSGVVDGLRHHATYLPLLTSLSLPPGLTRWHQLSGLVLVVYAVVHALRRRSRLRRSHIQ